MVFSIKTDIRLFDTFGDFLDTYRLNNGDLILTNEYVLKPHLGDETLDCHVIYQENFGRGEPNDEMIDSILEAVGDKKIDRVFAIGGGTILDIGKLLVFGGNYRCQEIFLNGKSLSKKRKLIAVPTTCGTGSEVTNISIAEIRALHTKMGLVTPQLYPDEAALVPTLLEKLPYPVFSNSSIDALIHAMEAYVSNKATSFSDIFAEAAIRKIIPGFQKVLCATAAQKSIAPYMKEFQIASTMAGIAFGNAGCGVVHALSYPIGANFHVPHGKANYLLLDACFRMYAKKNVDMSRIEALLAEVLDVEPGQVWDELKKLLDRILPREPLEDLGMTQVHLQEFPCTVLNTQQRLLGNMPTTLDEEDIKSIYKECMTL